MRKFLKIIVVLVFLASPVRVHAAGVGSAALAAMIYIQLQATHLMQVLSFALELRESIKTVYNTYNQLQRMIDAERRALNNLRSIADVRSISDFMTWQNRQLFLAREAEWHFDRMNVRVGGNTYSMREIEDIPNALRNSFRDPFERDFSEEDRRNLLLRLGMAPGNYTYLRTWEQRNNEIARRIMTYSNIFHAEHEEAAMRNQAVMDRYSVVNEDLDINEILMETHVTAMNTEMAIREQTRIMIEMHEYTLSRDRMMDTPPTPPSLSHHWNSNHFDRITEGIGINSFSDL